MSGKKQKNKKKLNTDAQQPYVDRSRRVQATPTPGDHLEDMSPCLNN